MLVALAAPTVMAFAGRFVVAGAQPGPGSQMLGRGEPGRWIGADFADDRRRAMPCDPRDRLVSSRWAQKGCIICSTCSSSVGSSSWSRWAGCNRHIWGVMIVEARLQRPLQIRDFRAHPALRLLR